ncbi:hypothetical protein LLH00_10550 [bacterium]|nr:hypothetical protein [bacterium]
MRCNRVIVLLAAALGVIAALPLPAAQQDGELKSFSREITAGQDEYVIEVGGTLDPQNVEIKIENLGDSAVADPWVTVNGKFDWFDIHSLAAEITAGCSTDEEKALAIWDWLAWRRFQRSPHDDSALQPVRGLNGYGYGICGHAASWVEALCREVGVTARVWEIAGHTVNEVFWDGRWHMLDANVKVFYLGRDNRTIASMAELEKDKGLIERTIHVRDPWVRQDDPPGRNIQFVRYLITEKNNWISDGYQYQNKLDYNMGLSLKPGETLTRWWEPRLDEFESPDADPLAPQVYANGRLEWEPDLGRIDLAPYIEVGENAATRAQDGLSPALHPLYLQDRVLYNRPSSARLHLGCPWPIVGGRFFCRLVKGGEDGEMAGVSFGGGEEGTRLYNWEWGHGTQDIELDLDPSILKAEPLYNYQIVFSFKGRAETKSQSGVDGLRAVTDFQVSPHSLPALSLGRNVVRYRDSSPGPHRVRITHTWREKSGNHPPQAVETALVTGEQKSLAPTLSWKAAADPDPADSTADYQVLVSLRPDCRWPLSPSLYRSLGAAATTWKVPAGFLNPGSTYYWKVRARDSHGAIGPWSEVFSFRTSDKAK